MATVRPARPEDVGSMQAVGEAAGRLFASHDDPRVAACADDPPLPLDDLAAWADAGRAWVAVEGGAIVGFVVVDVVDDAAHVEEVAVLPEEGGRGTGTALLDEVVRWAGDRAVTLTTFADVAWNRPWYERLGFRVLTEPELTPGLRARRDEEAGRGLDPSIRVCMRRDL